MQTDPDNWPQPMEWRPERFDPRSPEGDKHAPHSFLAFSYGPRSCIGTRFAIFEAVVAIAMIMQSFSIEFCDGIEPNPKELRTLVVKPEKFSLLFRKRT